MGNGKEWVLAISFLFALTILVFIFNGVFNYHLAPTFIDLMPDTDTGDDAIEGINQWLTYWKFIPLIILSTLSNNNLSSLLATPVSIQPGQILSIISPGTPPIQETLVKSKPKLSQ